MKGKFSNALSLALILAMLVTSLGFADTLTGDGDVVVAGNQTNVNLGTVSPSAVITRSVSFKLVCDGKNHVDSNQTVNLAFSVSGSTIPAGGSLNSTNTTIGPIPAAWADDTSGGGSTNCTSPAPVLDDNGDVTVTITAPTNPGPYTFVVQYNNSLTPAGNGDPQAIAGSSPSITYTLVVSAPSDPTPPVITPSIVGTLGNNGWYTSDVTVSWTVTDPESTPSYSCPPTTINADTAGTIVSCSATSAGGTSSQSVTIKRDATAPSISGAASPAPNAAGWNNTDVNVSFSCSDGTSGVASCGPDQTLTNNGADQSASGTVVDKAGNSASATVSNIDIDKELPTITASLPAANGNGWYNGPVTATFDCSDGYSGVAVCAADYTFTGDGSGQSYTGQASDYADNQNSTNVSVNIDATAPLIALVSRTPANAHGWNNGDVTMEWSCADSGSGVVQATITQTISAEGANQSASATCEDLAGNTASDTQTGINIDLTAPTASAGALPAPNVNGWNNTDVTVSFSGLDGLSGIDSCDAPVVLSGEGAGQSASGTCTDKAGNVSTLASVSNINIDKTSPTASATASPAANANGWNNTAVTVRFSGDDGTTGSGIDFCDADVLFDTEGAGQVASGTCTDKAGNVSDPATATVNIDLTKPLVALVGGPADGGTYYFGFVPAAPTCDASDALSGLDGSCAVGGYSDAIGTHTVTASATDKAGNSASASATYEVKAWTFGGFYQPVDMGGVFNTVKGGSTVPLKFEIFAGTMELKLTSYVTGFNAQAIACPVTGFVADEIEVLVTGGTVLRFDTTGDQFIFNWQTPKKPGSCYKVTMTTIDGSSLSAFFKLK